MKRWHFAVISVAVVLVAGLILVVFYAKSTSTWAKTLTWPDPDLSAVSDGTYEGSSSLKMPAGTAAANTTAVVRVTIRNHRYTAIEVVGPSAMTSTMRPFIKSVIDRQSLKPDSITGATVTKAALLIAAANALSAN
ncbi:MAG TPA: hypothetical protein VMW69_07320 [Spirochaetia bacterium]|nr:hypothetical protein [Spirochaetia bacterium]